MAGVAGALYVLQVGIINPSEFAPANSIEEVIWGRGRRAAARSRARSWAPSWSTTARPTSPRGATRALLAVCARRSLSSGVTLLMPRGIVGTIRHLWGEPPQNPRRPIPTRSRSVRRRRAEVTAMDGRETSALLYLDGVSVSFRRLSGAQRVCRSRSIPAKCAPSSARTAPARPP